LSKLEAPVVTRTKRIGIDKVMKKVEKELGEAKKAADNLAPKGAPAR